MRGLAKAPGRVETRLCGAEPQENGENDVRVSPEEGATLSDFALGQTI
jgi:hypothetical protein